MKKIATLIGIAFATQVFGRSIDDGDIDIMMRKNPARLLGLNP